MRGSKSCCSCIKSGHMMKNCPYMRGEEKGKDKIWLNGPSKEPPKRQRLFELKSKGVREDLSGDVSGA